MSAQSMPLSGAILVTNPRRSEPVGLALTNPNDRRRINAVARLVHKGLLDLDDGVMMIIEGKSKKQIQQSAGRYSAPRTTKKQWLEKGIASNQSEAAKKKSRIKLAGIKDKIVRRLSGTYNAGLSGKGSYGVQKRFDIGHYARTGEKRFIKVPYHERALKSHASRYITKGKTESKRSSQKRTVTLVDGTIVDKPGKVYKVFGTPYRFTDADALVVYNEDRQARRKAGKKSYSDIFEKVDGKWRSKKKAKTTTGGAKRAAGRSAGTDALKEYNDALRMIKAQGLSHADAKKMLKDSKDAGIAPMQAARKFIGSIRAANNPGVFGGLAMTNPSYDFMGFAKYSATALIAGGASYKIHQIAVPWVQENVYDRIPVVGEYLNQYPYAATGVIASGALGIAASKIGGVAGMYLGVVAGAVALTGGVLQAQDMFGGESLDVADEFEGDAELAGLAMTNPGVFSGLALENNAHAMGGLALENPHGMAHLNGIAMDNGGFGDGMAYQVAPLGMPDFSEGHSEYSGASLADALTSGADLSVDEGNAAVLGKHAYLRRFGRPTVRHYAMGAPRGKSHLAGRPGHRWGWLIKMIGFQRFQALAALPPKKRLAVLKKMRASAIQAYKAEMVDHGVPPAQPEFVSGVTASVPGAANGPDTSYGAMLMASPSYL